MFESIKHWLESLDENTHHFRDRDDESLHLALASVLHHVINTDHKESSNEVRAFEKILEDELDLNHKQVEYLHSRIEKANSNFEDDLKTINDHLKDNRILKMQFLEKLIKLISVDGVLNDELEEFNQTLHIVFPEIKSL